LIHHVAFQSAVHRLCWARTERLGLTAAVRQKVFARRVCDGQRVEIQFGLLQAGNFLTFQRLRVTSEPVIRIVTWMVIVAYPIQLAIRVGSSTISSIRIEEVEVRMG
jgi:hypothetical protein